VAGHQSPQVRLATVQEQGAQEGLTQISPA
jgi:hypothetical protein